MFSKFIPDAEFRQVSEITPQWLKSVGIRALALDNDNTVAKYSETAPAPEIAAWVEEMRSAGIGMAFVSNTHHPARITGIAGALGLQFRTHCAKPSARGFLWAAETLGVEPSQLLSVGDQVFTDVLGAHRAGARAAIVYPRGMEENILFRLRRLVELPFIGICRKRERKRKKNA